MASQMASAPSAVDAAQQLFAVDADGNGAGRIVSETGDVYEGSFLNWHRHGFGIQRWSNGSFYRGSWEVDQQACGVYQDSNGARWKGNFRTGEVERVQEEEQTADHTQPHEQQAEEKHDETVTHFPSSNYQFQHAYEYDPADPFSQTQPALSSSSTYSQTHLLPPMPHSARSHSTSSHRSPQRSHRQHMSQTPRRVPFTRTRESKQQREEREARERKEEMIVLKELAASSHLMSSRFGSSRLPGEATFGLASESPGPAAYSPSLTQVKRRAPKLSMAPRLPFQSEVAQIVKTTASSGPWSTNVTANNPSKPTIPAISLPQPPLLPQYVKDSDFFKHDLTPGPGYVDPSIGPKGSSVTIAKNTAPVADHGGYAIKGYPIPMYLGKLAHSKSGLGQGDPALYSPKIDFVSNRESAPKFTMRPRYRDHVYRDLKLAAGPSPAEYSPKLSQQYPDPMARAAGWGRSRAGQRPNPVESVRAVAYQGEKFMRNQLGLFSPGPANYNIPSGFAPPSNTINIHPAPSPSISFAPHIIQPPAVRLVKQFIGEQHPFVEKFKEQQQKESQSTDGQEREDETNHEEQETE